MLHSPSLVPSPSCHSPPQQGVLVKPLWSVLQWRKKKESWSLLRTNSWDSSQICTLGLHPREAEIQSEKELRIPGGLIPLEASTGGEGPTSGTGDTLSPPAPMVRWMDNALPANVSFGAFSYRPKVTSDMFSQRGSQVWNVPKVLGYVVTSNIKDDEKVTTTEPWWWLGEPWTLF